MTTFLRDAIAALANEFARGVLELIRSTSVAQILAETAPNQAPRKTRGRPPREAPPPRRSPESRSPEVAPEAISYDLFRIVDRVVAIVALHPEGVLSDDIASSLAMTSAECAPALARAVSLGRVASHRSGRAVSYVVPSVLTASAPRAAARKQATSKSPARKQSPTARVSRSASAQPRARTKPVAPVAEVATKPTSKPAKVSQAPRPAKRATTKKIAPRMDPTSALAAPQSDRAGERMVAPIDAPVVATIEWREAEELEVSAIGSPDLAPDPEAPSHLAASYNGDSPREIYEN